MLSYLHLKNFKKHDDLEITLNRGLNLITGPNYSGKSSILHAILFALWGPSAVPGGASLATKQGSTGMQVELGLTIGNKEWRIVRTGKTAELYAGKELVASSASVVTQEVANLVGIDKTLFTLLKYGEQGETKALLTLGTAELNKLIEKVSDVEIVDRVIDRCSEIVSECKGGLNTLGPVMDEAEASALQLEADALTALLSVLYSDISQYNEALKEAHERYSDLAQRQADGTLLNERRQQLLGRVVTLTTQISTTERELAIALAKQDEITQRLADYDGCEDEHQSLVTEIHEQRHAYDRWRELTVACEKEIEQVQAVRARIAQLEDSKHRAGVLLDLTQMATQVTYLNTLYTEVKNKLAELFESERKAVCPTCKRPFDAAQLTEVQSQIKALRAELPLREQKARTKQAELDTARERNEAIHQLERECEQLTLTAERHDEAVANLKEQSNEWSSKYGRFRATAVLEKEEAAARTRVNAKQQLLGEHRHVISSVRTLNDTLRRLRAENASLPSQIPERVDVEALQQELQQVDSDRVNLTKMQRTCEQQYAENYAAYDVRTRKLKEHMENQEKRSTLERQMGTAEKLTKFLRSNRERFLTEVWDGVLGYASAFAANCTGGEVESLRRHPKWGFSYVEGGQEMPIAAASGGQKTILGLGVQLGLAELLPGAIGTVLLDEPTADLDQERSLALSSVLPLSSQQLIVVTHRLLDTAAASTVTVLG